MYEVRKKKLEMNQRNSLRKMFCPIFIQPKLCFFFCVFFNITNFLMWLVTYILDYFFIQFSLEIIFVLTYFPKRSMCPQDFWTRLYTKHIF